ncbi:MAG TPA: gliding motility lipoprotein GldH [Bacteroidales bacterium]|nr:gliding motility lipoprotein GldH [Bacteroidales bacterium]
MKRNKVIFGLFLVLILQACNQKEIYFSYQTIPSSGWNKDSILNFDINVEDTIFAYNVLIHLRHFGNYPYQNMWLFLESKKPHDNIAQKDTIEFFLADDFGKWLGKGSGALKEMPVLYKQQIQFPDSGLYQLSIRHGMRDSILKGVNDVGVRVEKID